MPRVRVDLVSDSSSFTRSFQKGSSAVKSFDRDLSSLGVTSKRSADLQVQAALKVDSRLRSQIRDYHAVANAAVRGSREQVVAANLAARAEQKLARSLSVTAAEARIHARSVAASERSLGRLSRGALAGSGAFRGLGRSLAFASSAFLGGAGLTFALRSTISAAAQAQLVNVQLARSLQAVGLSYAANRQQIEDTIEAQAKLSAFDDEDLKQSFTALVRRTADVSKALQLNALAADIARARNITLERSSTLLIRAMAGNARAATTLGLPLADLGKNATKASVAQNILASAQQRYSGQAKVFGREAVGAQGRFNKSLQDSEEIIGGALIPVLARLADRFATYLDRINKSGQLQRDVNSAIRTAGQVFAGFRDVLNTVRAILGPVNEALGGTKNTIKALFAVIVLSKLRGLALGLAGVEAAAGAAAGASGVAGLTTKLLALKSIGRIVIPIAIVLTVHEVIKKGSGFIESLPGAKFVREKLGGNFLNQKLGFGDTGGDSSFDQPGAEGGSGPGVHGALLANQRKREQARAKALQALLASQKSTAGKQVRAQNLLERTLARFQLAATRARLTKSLVDDQKVLLEEEAFLRKELRNHLLSAATRQGIQQQIADTEVSLSENRAAIVAQAQERQQQALAQRNARQFKSLGLGATGDVLAPTKKALRAELGNISQALKGTFLDTGAHRSLMRNIRRLLSGQLGALSSDVRNKIKELLDDLKGQLGEFDGFNLTAADRRRRFLDKRRADRYAGKADHPTVQGKSIDYHPTIYASNPRDWEKADKRQFWRLKNA